MKTVIRSRPIQFAEIVRNMGIGFFSAVVTGIISGLLLRLVMRIVAIVFPEMARGFTIQGTLVLVFVGIGFSLANSIIYTCIHRFLPAGWVRKGLLYGGMNLCILGVPFFLSNPDNDLFGPQAPLGIALFSMVFLIGSLLLAMLVDLLANWVEQSNSRKKFTYLSFALLIIPAIIMSYGIVYEIITELIPAIMVNLKN